MNYYEIVYIVHPALQAGHLDDTVNQINKKIVSLKGDILFFENWGKKKLSYAIDKQKYGTYILLQFSMSGEGIKELMDEFEHNSNVLRYLINRIEKEDILEQKKEILNVEESSDTEKKSIDEKESNQTDDKKTNEKIKE